MRKNWSALIVMLDLLLPATSFAQTTATAIGTVVDTTGALIPVATVTATNTDTGISTMRVSGDTGSYTIPGLQPGPYSIVASLPGFSDSTIEVNLNQNQTFRLNFELQVGTVETAVEVISDAGASVGDALPENEILSLPLRTRNVFDLLKTTAGLASLRRFSGTNFAGTRVSSVNTTRDGVPVSDGRYLDWNGASSATYSSPDLVEEIQISVGTVDAAAGRGSSQVRLQTRSGTNEYHGALFYTTNNSALNANTWFDNLRGNDKDWTNRQQFGGRIGGPIIGNKAFFFVLIDEQRYLTRANIRGEVWTAEARAGIFRYFPGVENQNVLAGPDASVDLAGNPTRPAGATGPLASFNLFSDVNDPFRGTGITKNVYIQETLRRMPLPNDFTGGDGLNTARVQWVRRTSGSDNAAGTSQNTNRDNLNVRLDYQISDGNKILFVMTREHNFGIDVQPTWPGGFAGTQNRDPRIYTLGWTSSISPTILNEFRYGFRSTGEHLRPPYTDGCCFGKDGLETSTDTAKELFALFETSNGYPFLPALQTLGGNKWMAVPMRGAPNGRGQNSPLYTFSDTISWVQGAHSFTAGWDGTWADSDGWGSGSRPRVTIGDGQFEAPIEGFFPGLANNDAGLASGILNDLSGSVSTLRMGYFVNDPAKGFDTILDTVKNIRNPHQDDWAAFFKDDWNVTPNLTINYGVRWDVYGVIYEGKGQATVATNGNFLGISGDGTLTSVTQVGRNSPNPGLSVYDKDWNNVAPSFGFSYRVPWIDRTTVVRGGYGISYAGAPQFLEFDFGIGRQPGQSFTVTDDPTVYTALSGTTNPTAPLVQFPLENPITPFGTVPLTDRTATLYHYAADRRIPYIQNFNLSIETEIAPDTNLSVSWIGTSGVALWGGRQINEPDIFRAQLNGESFLDAFITTREGGNSPLFNDMLNGINFRSGTCGVVNGTTCTGSQVLRQSRQTYRRVANGESAWLAEWFNNTNFATGVRGGLLRTNGYPENFLVLNPQFNQVDLFDNGDNSTYHSLQVQVTKRLSSGFSGQFSYTWSKSIGNAGTSGFRAREDESFGTRDWRNRNLNKGVLPFHRTHGFNAHGVWELPFGPGRALGSGAPSVVARVIEVWQLSSIVNWSSGQPLSVNTGRSRFANGGLETISAEDNINSANLVGGLASFPRNAGSVVVGDGVVNFLTGYSRVDEPSTGYFGTDPDNLARPFNLSQIVDSAGNVVLSNPKPGTTGNLSSGWLEGPPLPGLDVALMKAIQITEGTEFTIRVDAINILNTPFWDNPNTNIASSNFGRITNATGQRTFTLNARIDF